jgi:alkylation response protein AidB-like acyl-CoA dehydrogenase
VIRSAIFEHETAIACAPTIVAFGPFMIGPVLLAFGTDAQKRHWLPRILDGSDWWCQGYSEPGAGSDLAGLRMTAVRDGDHYVVNGQKTWTTLGHFADMIFCLVRTDPAAKKQQGISFLLIDMKTPGVEVRPLLLLNGEHEVNEVFFTDVRVPVENRVGEENRGWTYAKYLLTHERANIAGMGFAFAAFERLRQVAGEIRSGGGSLLNDPLFAARVARVEIDLANLYTTSLRVLASVAGDAPPGPEGSMLKIRGTEIRQEIFSLTRRALGPYARPFVRDAMVGGSIGPEDSAAVAAAYFNHRKLSIYGGSNEVQRNIVSKTMLGL